jgi:hypothetical protein
MRFSGLYALLDQLPFIEPKHHHAAMALWNYCEQSACWIVGISTGDRNADKIFAALRHAPGGLTTTEISEHVFNRHASGAEIHEALNLLNGLTLTYSKTETTGGAAATRWFLTEETAKKRISE